MKIIKTLFPDIIGKEDKRPRAVISASTGMRTSIIILSTALLIICAYVGFMPEVTMVAAVPVPLFVTMFVAVVRTSKSEQQARCLIKVSLYCGALFSLSWIAFFILAFIKKFG